MAELTIDDWYDNLHSLRVDLVGDYAGSETFIVEGDSLLLQCFSDPKLDFSNGLQLLHATFNVEQLLSKLAARGCNFHIVFFDDHRHLCVPSSAISLWKKYLLARSAILRHLEKNLLKAGSKIAARSFPTIESPAFLKYIQGVGAYFALASDSNSLFSEGEQEVDEEVAKRRTWQKSVSRWTIYWFMRHGYNVALLNGLEFADTKVMAMVLEGRRQKQAYKRAILIDQDQDHVDTEEFDGSFTNLITWQKERGIELSERELLILLFLSHVSRHKQVDAHLASLFLLHTACSSCMPLSSRRFTLDTCEEKATDLIDLFTSWAGQALRSENVLLTLNKLNLSCDLADLVDARMFFALCSAARSEDIHSKGLASSIRERYAALNSAFSTLCGHELSAPPSLMTDKRHGQAMSPKQSSLIPSPSKTNQLLPFSHSLLDEHLAPIHLAIDESSSLNHSSSAMAIFNELSHWHNARRPLAQKGHIQQLDYWALRRNQKFMAEMIAYAASLTNAAGKVLEPEIIISQASGKIAPLTILNKDSENHSSVPKKAQKGGGKKGGQGNKKGGKAAAFEAAAAKKAEKSDQEEIKFLHAWDSICHVLEKEEDPSQRYVKARKYLNSLSPRGAAVVGPEVELFQIGSLFEIWTKERTPSSRATTHKRIENGNAYVALIWDLSTRLSRNQASLSRSIVTTIKEILDSLGLPTLPFSISTSNRILPFSIPALKKVKRDKLDISLHESPLVFQLNYCGPYFDRSIDSAPDARVSAFEPDGWQRRVLDSIDKKESLLVVAPTSAGKTFISFYAMKQILEANGEDVLVYVAPTKALVNQIAAEVQARFTKTYKHAGKSVWGIHTRDYRINSPTGCQILVTVPHILQIMLLAPSNANSKNSWSNRVKSIIFDEVHCIGQADDGLVWEQLLLLAPCPIIALSATVGNPTELRDWLRSTQKAIGNELVMVQHSSRYSDLRKFVYQPPKAFVFEPMTDQSNIPIPGLDGSPAFSFVHPVASLVDRSRGIPEDLSLEARDCLSLYESLAKHQKRNFGVDRALHPAKALPTVIRKPDLLKWEASLKDVLQQWMKDPNSPFNAVVQDLGKTASGIREPYVQGSPANSQHAVDGTVRAVSANDLCSTTLPMLIALHQKDALPAILFNYDRSKCEKLASEVVKELESAEMEWKESSTAWQKKMTAFTEWSQAQEIALELAKKANGKDKKPKKKNRGDGDGDGDDNEEPTSKFDLLKDKSSGDFSKFASFDPAAPVDGFHFADWKKLLPSELKNYQRDLNKRGVPSWLVQALSRGVGIHHAGMNRKYRQVVEILFRKGFLRVVVATGTLALGINMPCKTVVFSGDSIFLTALNFRQAGGRAGRRGFDVLGNVVFQGIEFDKVCRLLSSRLPDLNGHFPITTSLVLRLFSLLHETKNSTYAANAVKALITEPRLCLGGPEAKMTVLHHLRFSIEYLRRQSLLSSTGVPLNFAGAVSHLYYTENSGFAFHALLKDGYFHSLCANIDRSPRKVLLELMLMMAHLFGRIPYHADQEFIDKVVKRSPSVVFLPSMPKGAERILRTHNKETLDIFRAYVQTYVDQHIREPDRRLPLTNLALGPAQCTDNPTLTASLPGVQIRSAFVALSGHGDEFNSIADLCRTVRSGVFLEESVIPHVQLYPEEADTPLNAYLYDFFKHGDVLALEKANRISKGNVWFALNDFSLVLATIVTSLSNFMKLTPESDLDMIDVQGSGDAVEEEAGDAIELQTGDQPQDISRAESELDGSGLLPSPSTTSESSTMPSWTSDDGTGLMNVLKAFKLLQQEFNVKFKAMWA